MKHEAALGPTTWGLFEALSALKGSEGLLLETRNGPQA